ncbi:hypothetical protein [Arthrobacter globiformis]|nr:hypothetical protein [Arthrobacter globiformis]
MTSGDEKDPPVPADLVGAPRRIRREQGAEADDRSDQEDLVDDPNDGD